MSGAATIQSKNVAAVAAVAAAAAVAGLASPAATHHMKKLRVLSKKTALFLSLFLFFFEQPSLFSHVHARPKLVQQQGWINDFFSFFCWAFFGKTMGYLLNLFLHPFVHLFSSAGVQLHQEPLLLLQDL